jgi:Icc protein
MAKTVRFIHISDTHLGPDPEFELYGINTCRAARALVKAVNEAPTEASFIIHTGDVVAHPDERAYRLAAEIFSPFRLPVYYVTGNHDESSLIRKTLSFGECSFLPAQTDRLCYRFMIAHHSFLVLDARGPDEIDPHGILAEEQLEVLARELAEGHGPLTVFVHFPPLPLDSLWLDEEMLLLNGGRMHELLRGASPRLQGVFFGHIHRGTVAVRDGILYSGVGSSFRQFSSWPASESVAFDDLPAACFNLVAFQGSTVSIRHHSIPVGFG